MRAIGRAAQSLANGLCRHGGQAAQPLQEMDRKL